VSDGPDVLGLQRGLWTYQSASIPGATRLDEQIKLRARSTSQAITSLRIHLTPKLASTRNDADFLIPNHWLPPMSEDDGEAFEAEPI
jgi:hypothetical protein